ncbi:L-ascorbate metabolism protein UlaG (beta-lactamase superfamily) [Kribbella sp. VKM Ac-2527]|uniref:L-ascorbate metabolism protein UlaG (Beta-lactamase superfamily) n=1 Tax=Kribbella caucasensis TaxID=2512215 RepID=A0A4R6KRY6_9ACTN|nr:MBL fold metallo-hydrolase [Kribbella sp. VKM Ac-2527]TDO52699.1 L-ascorbate metabolism protein UlaG (beta-lactamase superfamily) [Kribbella sp. VKM Ac-2527]
MTDVRITHIGGPTTLIEIEGWRLLTDPTFDPPGRRYTFGWGSASTKMSGPTVAVADLPPIDAVLLTHDQHADNLDDAGRALLPAVGTVITTAVGARRLGAVGLTPWSVHSLRKPGLPTLEITATPCRHGPPFSRRITGDVVGFALRWEGQEHGILWISGDTVLYDGLRQVGDRFDVGTVLLHLGAVQFGITGPLRYTMSGPDGVELCRQLRPRTVLPVHYEGWSHFTQGRDTIEQAFAAAPADVSTSLSWLPTGTSVTVPV